MLKSVDILIGLSVVMLVLGMAVTVITQALLQLRQQRGKKLLDGLADLVRQFDPDLDQHARTVAEKMLRHPMICESGKLGTIVHRHEFARLLLEFAARAEHQRGDAAEQALWAAVSRHVPSASATLAGIRSLAVQLERSNPELAESARQNLAILHESGAEFTGRINAWFDHAMDRVSERFTLTARQYTVVAAAAVAIIAQVDTLSIINRLSWDDRMRDALVREATVLARGNEPAPDAAVFERQRLRALAETGVVRIPASLADWGANWKNVNLGGLVISVLLLSLGGPFWYSVLGKLLRLRSALAQKEDDQRTERQTFTPALAGGSPAGLPGGSPALLAGERGDLTAVG